MKISNNKSLSLLYSQVIPRINPKSTKRGSRNGWLCVSGHTHSPERISLNLELTLSWGAGGERAGQCILATPTPPTPDQSHPDWLYLCLKYYVNALINLI